MTYFLDEDSISKTMEAIKIKSDNPEKFNRMLREIENQVLAD